MFVVDRFDWLEVTRVVFGGKGRQGVLVNGFGPAAFRPPPMPHHQRSTLHGAHIGYC